MGENALQGQFMIVVLIKVRVLHLIMQIQQKILNNKNLDTIANELEGKKKRIFFTIYHHQRTIHR